MFLRFSFFKIEINSFFIDLTTPGPLKTIPVYNCTTSAPAHIFSKAVLPESTPPTPIIFILPLVSL